MQSRTGNDGKEFNIKLTLKKASIDFVKSITVPYAFIHENGGTFNVTITARMRSFFWVMYRETQDPMFKYMALTKKLAFRITIPSRAYVEPAIDDEREEIANRSVEELLKLIERSFR